MIDRASTWSRAALLALLSCGASGAAVTSRGADGTWVYDAGPAEIPVADYPPERQKAYKTFADACSQCHTLARPINAPHVTRQDWERYVRRMQVRASGRGRPIPKDELRAIVDFLVYDASVRKLGRPDAWKAEQARVRQAYERSAAERRKSQTEEGRRKARDYFDPAGVKPSGGR